MGFFKELKRRNVVRMALFYLLGAWVVLQVADVLVGVVGLPDWTLRLVGLVLLLGLPLVLVLSWVYQVTPEGLKRESSQLDTGEKVVVTPVQRTILALSFLVVMGSGYYLVERFLVQQQEAAKEQSAVVAPTPEARTDPVIFAVSPVTVRADGDVPEGMLGNWQWMIDLRMENWWRFRVIPRDRVELLASETDSDAALAEALGATHLLKSTLWVSGDEGRIDLQVFDAAAGRDIWAMSFSDPLLIGNETQTPVMTDLELELDRFLAEEGLAERFIKTDNKLAHEAWWMAKHWDDFEDPDTERLRWYNEAIMLDPGFAQAYADLARYWFLKTNRGVPWSEVREAAFAAAERALELDPNHGDTHANLGRMYELEALTIWRMDNDFETAKEARQKGLEHAKQAVQLEPEDIYIREYYVRALYAQRDWEEIINQLEIAYRYTQDTLYLRHWKVIPMIWLRRVDEAADYLEELKKEFPQVDWEHTDSAFMVHRAQGDNRAALASLYPRIHSKPDSWVMDYMDLLADIGALEAVGRWGRHLAEVNDGQAVNYAGSWIFSSLSQLRQYEAAIAFLDGLSEGVINDEDRMLWKLNTDYQKIMQGTIDDPSLQDELGRLVPICEQRFFSSSEQEADSGFEPGDLLPAIKCFVLSTRLGLDQKTLGERILRYFDERDPIELDPPGMRNTVDGSLLNLIYALGAMGEIERALEVLREVVGQGFSQPHHFRTYGLLPDLAGTYNGLGSHPEFLEIVEEMEAKNAAIRADIESEAPWLFDPVLTPPETAKTAGETAGS
jgi:tetratricopeptide (TPR) repeat protein